MSFRCAAETGRQFEDRRKRFERRGCTDAPYGVTPFHAREGKCGQVDDRRRQYSAGH